MTKTKTQFQALRSPQDVFPENDVISAHRPLSCVSLTVAVKAVIFRNLRPQPASFGTPVPGLAVIANDGLVVPHLSWVVKVHQADHPFESLFLLTISNSHYTFFHDRVVGVVGGPFGGAKASHRCEWEHIGHTHMTIVGTFVRAVGRRGFWREAYNRGGLISGASFLA